MASKKLQFAIDVIKEEDGVGYYVVVPTLPGCFSQGATVEEAIHLHISALKKNGEKVPNSANTFHTTVEVAA